MRYALRSLAVVAALSAVSAASCPSKNGVTNFNMTAFLGVWREVLRVPSSFETDYSCMMDHYYRSPQDDRVLLSSVAYNSSKGAYDSMEGIVEIEAPEENGQFLVKTGNDSAWNSRYWVLGTDYTNYLVLFGCLQGEDGAVLPLTWVMVRQLPLGDQFVPIIDEILGANHVVREQMEAVPQNDCPSQPRTFPANENQ